MKVVLGNSDKNPGTELVLNFGLIKFLAPQPGTETSPW